MPIMFSNKYKRFLFVCLASQFSLFTLAAEDVIGIALQNEQKPECFATLSELSSDSVGIENPNPMSSCAIESGLSYTNEARLLKNLPNEARLPENVSSTIDASLLENVPTEARLPEKVSSLPESVSSDESFVEPYTGLQEVCLSGAPKWKRDDIVTIPKFGGYIIGSYKYHDAPGMNNGDGFNLRLIRFYVDGFVFRDFKYRVQFELNETPHLKDATIEWVHWKELQVKAGQFKRAFGLENPMNPWDIGSGDYTQLSKKLIGYSDRCGEAPCGGRDIGIQLQGDLFPSKCDKHAQLHYQFAVYNGQGINSKDKDNKKDFIGMLQWSPLKNLSIAAFGWLGSWYCTERKIAVDRKRFAFGLKYAEPTLGLTFRTEYARSFGYKATDWNKDTASWSEECLAQNGGDKSDAWYAVIGMPVWRWFSLGAKYDVYRDYALNSSMHSIYSAVIDLQPHKNLKLQLQYNHHNDKLKTAPSRYYNEFWAMSYIRF